MKLVLFANTDWYLYNFRRSLALAIQEAGHEVLLVSPVGPYVEKLSNLGLRWMAAPMHRKSLNPFRELALMWWLLNLLKSEKPDLVHGFTIKCAVYGALAARWVGRRIGRPARVSAVAGMGYVFSSNDLKARLLRPWVSGLLQIALGGSNARLILQNPDDVALFEKAQLANPQQIRLIMGSGVNCDRLKPSNREQSDSPRPVKVLLIARLLWDKGIREYIEAARALRASNVDFLLAGAPDAGNPAAIPEQTVRGWESEGLIRWHGHVEDMPTLYASVDMVVLPSYREGLPKTLIEAAACALPIVTTDVPGCREVVTHGVDGLLVPVKDSVALAGAIERLVANPKLRKQLGTAAREKALKKFDEKAVIRQTLAVYSELMP